MVKCKTCEADIAKAARTCPKCGAKNRKAGGALGAAIVVVAVILVISAILGGGDKSEPKKVDPSAPAFASSAVAPAPPSVAPEQTSFSVGDKVSLNDVDVTFVSCEESQGSQFNKPTDGNAFVLCEFIIENNSTSDIAVSSMMSFEAYVDDFSTTISVGSMISTDKKQLDGSVAAGKKMSGIVGYEVPTDWKELEIRFTPSFWSGKDITFVATK